MPSLNLDYIFFNLYKLFTDPQLPSAKALIDHIAPYSIVLSMLFAVGIIYSLIRTAQVRKEENLAFESIAKESGRGEGKTIKNEKWARVLAHIASGNPNDWRLAILEADIMLGEMLDIMGQRGETMSDKLKNIEKSDFNTIDLAWEAHKVRNKIAHSGDDFQMDERGVKRVIEMYRQVFDEFHYI